MAPFFSIILPVYNVAPYLKRCVRSITEQSFRDYELILVDDGSTDGSGDICDDLVREHPAARVIHKSNGGLASARNAGLELARGQYIWWVDSDDWIKADALEILHRTILDGKYDIIRFNYYRIEDSMIPVLSNASAGCYTETEREQLLEKALLTTGKFFLSACFCVYRGDFLREKGLRFTSEREICSEDYLFNLEALLLAREIRILEESLYYYELRIGSLTQTYKRDLPGKYALLASRLREVFQREGLLERWEERICCFYAWHLIRGICIPNEYCCTGNHTLSQGRRNVRCFLQSPEIRSAVTKCGRFRFSRKQQVQLWAMKWGLEPLFYWLYVIKPKIRKGKR